MIRWLEIKLGHALVLFASLLAWFPKPVFTFAECLLDIGEGMIMTKNRRTKN